MILSIGAFLWGCTPSTGNGASDRNKEQLIVFLVRHAEKVDNSMDPDLSRPGYLRAEELARTLKDAKIQYVHSSDYIRTRETAAPVAEMEGLVTELYDPVKLYALADRLMELGGRHLVVGHSNSTPALVEILGGDPGYPIEEVYEYDRLYILSISEDGVHTVLLRYGRSSSRSLSSNMASSRLVPQTSGSALN